MSVNLQRSFSLLFTSLIHQEEDGYTGLHHAAKQGNLEMVSMLLETGQVDVNAQVKEKWQSAADHTDWWEASVS